MLEIILLILKITGIVLLCILGLILLLLLIVLFAPVHYKIRAEYYGKLKSDVRITWLAHLVSGKFSFNDTDVAIKVRALWITLYDSQKALKEDELENQSYQNQHNKKKKHKEARSVFDESDSDVNVTHTDYSEEQEDRQELQDNLTQSITAGDNITEVKEDVSDSDRQEKSSVFKRICQRIKVAVSRIYGFIKSVIQMISDIIHKTMNAKEKAAEKFHQINDMIHDPDNRELVSFVKAQLVQLFKLIKPRRYTVNVHFGFDDPQITGKIAMWLAVMYGFLGVDMNIHPDFEQEIFEGEIELKGHIQIFGLVMIAIRCYTNKHIRKFINK